jgi:hypothetical protein
MTLHVLALVHTMGMVRGEKYDLAPSPTVDALIDRGFLLWLNPPAAEPVVTEVVKKRAPKKPKVEVSAIDADPEADLLVEQAFQELVALSEELGLYDEEESGGDDESALEVETR